MTVNQRKIAGVLVETRDVHGPACVVGIGVNVTAEPDEFPPELRTTATSVRIETGREARRLPIARDRFRSLEPKLLGETTPKPFDPDQWLRPRQ